MLHTITESSLRGRGGSGYPTGAKWRDCLTQPGPMRYVVANGFEADPGAQAELEFRSLHAFTPFRCMYQYTIPAFWSQLKIKSPIIPTKMMSMEASH